MDLSCSRKHLKEYTDKELYEFICRNETLTALELAGFCSEILRRDLKRKYGIEEENGKD